MVEKLKFEYRIGAIVNFFDPLKFYSTIFANITVTGMY